MSINKPTLKGRLEDVEKGLYGARVSLSLVSVLIFMLVLGGCCDPSKVPSKVPFPALCRRNFQSTNTSASTATVPTPPTSIAPDGEPIGLSEGANIFDLQRSNQDEVQYKLKAAQAIANDPQAVKPLLNKAISSDQTDAEAKIYLENWEVLRSNHPHITFVVGVSFASLLAGGSRGALQGAFTAQKECNDRNWQDASKTLIVLMIANIDDNTSDESSNSAKIVADQIADQESKDPTILAIMGWRLSADSINVNHQLKIRGSHLPMISPSASSDELEGRYNFFRICPTNREQTQIAANFILKKQQKKKIAIIYDNTNAYTNNLKEDFAKNIPKANIVGTEKYTRGKENEIQNALKRVLDQKPDAIFFAGYSSDLFELLKDIASTSYANMLIVGGDTLANTNNYVPPVPDLHNVYFTPFASPNEWEKTDPKPPFFQEYKDNFGTLTAPTGLPSIDHAVMLVYDAMSTLFYGSQQVLSMKKTISASDLMQALKQITGANAFQGITGRIAFDSNGDQDPRATASKDVYTMNRG
jgi:ABC-type branched-subunit amino acid transport system substrate-binding protein